MRAVAVDGPVDTPAQPESALNQRRVALFTRTAWLVSLLLVLPVVLLAILNRHSADAWQIQDPYFGAGGLTYAAVGALIVNRRPRNSLGWLFLVMGMSSQIGAVAAGWAVYGLETNPAVPGGDWGLWINLWIGVLTFMPMFPLLLFPDGRLHDRKTRIVAGLTLLSAVWLFFSLLVGTTVPPGFPEVYSRTPNPLFPGDPIGDAGLGIIALGICGLVSAGLLLERFRQARGTLRQQYMWIILVMCLLVLSFVSDFFARVATNWAFYITSPVMNISFALIPVAVGIAILRHRRFDIELIFSRALIYVLLSVCVVAIYVLVVGWLGTLFRTGGNAAFSLLAAGVVAVLFQPLREQIQRRVNRILFGDRDDPYAVISRLGQRLENTLAVDEILPAIAGTLREALKTPYAAIHVSRGLSPMLVVESGVPVANPLRLPLTFHHEHVGEILLALRSPGEDFGPADRRLLDDLARQTGVAVNAVRLTHELQYARERLVEAREEERRRLHRDLHDGLGSQLAALNLQFGALPALIDSDPAAAHAEILELRAQLRTAITSIRSLVHGLRPPAIDELGLVVALRERIRQFNTDRFVVKVDLPARLPDLPAAIEVAIYRVTEEALTNVAKHSSAGWCFVRLTIERSILMLHIEDDGVGIDSPSNVGVGLRSMRERAEELGGTFEIASRAGGGTIVNASFAFTRAEGAHG